MDYASVGAEKQERAKALDVEICEVSAHAHAAMARVARAAAEFDTIGGWCGGGIRSLPHWLAINAGFDMHTGAELVRVGHALNALPKIAEAFGAGQLSFDKVRQITTVATPPTEHLLLEIAQGSSGAQLARICRALRRIADSNASDSADEHLSLRGIWTHWDDGGMLRLVAKLTPEDAAVVMAALESITGSQPVPEKADDGSRDPADDRWAARRADALVAMCDHILAGGVDALVKSPAAAQVVVHVDVGVLAGETTEGRCYVEGGSPLSADAARRIGCDAEAVGVIERNGLPIDVGRRQRTVPDRLRLALHVRDRFCRFPGCGVPAHRTEAHHHRHWALGGKTNLDNLLLLCGFHHRRHHDGAYRIKRAEGGFSFETDDGRAIGSQAGALVSFERNPSIDSRTPGALWGGERMEFGYAVSVIADSCAFAEARAAPNN
ncbi:MAG TPA: DUF222 domain-containing protein [Candidatus Dormibacteraeota bacterium]|nr:DUF222 domain-containing protein [Candidatus Dormibacteraeota bacterium]